MASAGYSSYPAYVQYVIDASVGTQDPANNRTLVNFNAYVYVTGSSASSAGGDGSIYMNGNYVNSGSIGYWSLGRYGTVGITSGSAWAYHDANGYLSGISFSGSSSMAGLGSASVSGSLGGFPNYDRRPGSPAFEEITRTTGTGTFNPVRVSAVSSPAGTATYYVERSENSGAWGYQQSSTSTRSFIFTGGSLGSTQQFRTAAGNSDGLSAWTYSGFYPVPNVPSAPNTCTASAASGRAVTVTSGNALDNGAAIAGYYAQQSPDNGTTWQNAAGTVGGSDLMTSQAITYSGLLGGATYKFRVFAANEMGSGATTTSSSVFVPSGGKRFNGTSFINASKANRRNATNTAWVPLSKTKKYVNGAWTDFV